MASTPATYESQFTRENILDLKSHISRAVNEYAGESSETGKLDVFVILAALSQCAYEVSLHSLSESEEEKQQNIDQMRVLADKFINESDNTGQELGMRPAGKLLAITHTLSVMSEYYSHRRDSVILKMLQEAAEPQTAEVVELPTSDEK